MIYSRNVINQLDRSFLSFEQWRKKKQQPLNTPNKYKRRRGKDSPSERAN